ncbi:hypothetical protein JG688_00005004 [Phytophthora aleatoria]|uniref:HAT C-terminal dimerisation domain-containing protein n=1 Tax=Phytophthora aleatoria TaxID=2496075 RepID=A0A8J5IVQ2_9STRA|nr:hypothetical protein JG688_00005004 [Phytophthora aleatoria]
MDKWLNLRIEWDERQYPDADEQTMRLCQYIDVRRWFVETGERTFPTISMLARIWLDRSSSTAYQERIFSTGSFVMSPLRSRTGHETAQRQLILHHNRQEIEKIAANKRTLW